MKAPKEEDLGEPAILEPETVPEPPPREIIHGPAAEHVWVLTEPGGNKIKVRGESLEDALRFYNDGGHTSFTAKQLNPVPA